ncbi:GTP-binding protein Era [Solimonas aquatica]|uniref:GTPase Era n=1 Tax=Solimonas aquatica TaxID=489703 RepID=A0A1H9HCF7_9GAMM|nr:GTPase Era [Solimonas aquatica]SEQ60041.1 GTP-binding protein Era [Solimonas aquatica]
MRSGMVSIVGRPNVGKSSLLNALVGRKVSIVSHKPQTTRHQIQGVVNLPGAQLVFVDTPGLHRQQTRQLNRLMNETAAAALHDVDVVVLVLECGRLTEEDQAVLQRIKGLNPATPVGLVLNKIDRVKDREALLPELQKLAALHDFAFVVPLSALKRSNVNALLEELAKRLPEGPQLYPDDMQVGYDDAFLVSEIVREKLTRTLHQELPYSLTVSVEQYEREGRMDRVDAVIWVEREGQKKIVIGEGGAALKLVGSKARMELERLLGRKVFLKLWCRVRENWSDDLKSLKQFGLTPE